jgi:hypothetical protein
MHELFDPSLLHMALCLTQHQKLVAKPGGTCKGSLLRRYASNYLSQHRPKLAYRYKAMMDTPPTASSNYKFPIPFTEISKAQRPSTTPHRLGARFIILYELDLNPNEDPVQVSEEGDILHDIMNW